MIYKGFIKPTIEKDHYILGVSSLPFVINEPTGNWGVDLPIKEYQSKPGLETYNCTGFNTLNQIEAYMFKVFGEKVNYSDRWVGIISGTSAELGGNDPQMVCEAIRKCGLIPESMLPFSDEITSTGEYYSFKGADEQACRAEAQKWLEKWEFYHEWVFSQGQASDEKIHNMKVALKSSPLTMAVYAWAQDERGVFVKLGYENHWTCLYAIEDFQKVFDSYDPTDKNVEQDINFCKRIYIKKKEKNTPVAPIIESRRSLWTIIKEFFARLFIKNNA